jgi:glyoxylase-like metal-dependent hydrolase (beta-lactamase superfamily II)
MSAEPPVITIPDESSSSRPDERSSRWIELLDARLDHLGERLARELARAAVAHAGHLDHVGAARELAKRHAVRDLQLLGVARRRA